MKENQHKTHSQTLVALLVMLLWGALFPLVKIGYQACEIDTSSIGSILMFAGVRFVVCGLIIAIWAHLKCQRLDWNLRESLFPIASMGLFSIVLHYACTYIGLSITESSKTAILKQLGALLYICFSFLFVKEDKFNCNKLLGAFLGFTGILVINAGGGGSHHTLSLGDLLIIAASVCTVVSNLIGKKVMTRNPSMLTTGVSQLFGGIVLMGIAFLMNGNMPQISLSALLVFTAICFASVFSYCLWFETVRTGQLSQLFLIKFSEPIFASLFGALLLGENILRWQYLLSFVLIALGIICSHKEPPACKES